MPLSVWPAGVGSSFTSQIHLATRVSASYLFFLGNIAADDINAYLSLGVVRHAWERTPCSYNTMSKEFVSSIHSHLAIPDCINLRGGVRFMLASGIANLPCCPPFKFQQHQRARKYLLLLISNVNRTLKV